MCASGLSVWTRAPLRRRWEGLGGRTQQLRCARASPGVRQQRAALHKRGAAGTRQRRAERVLCVAEPRCCELSWVSPTEILGGVTLLGAFFEVQKSGGGKREQRNACSERVPQDSLAVYFDI